MLFRVPGEGFHAKGFTQRRKEFHATTQRKRNDAKRVIKLNLRCPFAKCCVKFFASLREKAFYFSALITIALASIASLSPGYF